METPMTDFFAHKPIPIEYFATHCPDYIVDGQFIFGVEKNGTYREAGEIEGNPPLFSHEFRFKHYARYLKSEDYEMFDVEKKSGQYVLEDMLKAGAEIIKEKNLQRPDVLLPWCRKYGLLAIHDESDLPCSEPPREHIDKKRLQNSLYFGFYWPQIADALVDLYIVFLCWKSLEFSGTVSEDEKLLLEEHLRIFNCDQKPVSDDYESQLELDLGQYRCGRRDNPRTPREYELERRQRYRAKIMTSAIGHSVTQRMAYNDNEPPTLIQCYKNAIDAAHSVLITTIGMSDKERKGPSVVCKDPECGKTFIRVNGNREYCDNCSQQSSKQKRYDRKQSELRRMRKEALQNGQATE